MERTRPRWRLPALAAGSTSRSATSRTSFPAPRSSIARPTGFRSTTAPQNGRLPPPTDGSRRSSSSYAPDESVDEPRHDDPGARDAGSPRALVHERELRGRGAGIRRGDRVGTVRRRDERGVRATREASRRASTLSSRGSPGSGSTRSISGSAISTGAGPPRNMSRARVRPSIVTPSVSPASPEASARQSTTSQPRAASRTLSMSI